MSLTFINEINKKCNIDLNSQQIDAVNHINGPGLVLAVPGSGKTTMMICRPIFLV